MQMRSDIDKNNEMEKLDDQAMGQETNRTPEEIAQHIKAVHEHYWEPVEQDIRRKDGETFRATYGAEIISVRNKMMLEVPGVSSNVGIAQILYDGSAWTGTNLYREASEDLDHLLMP